MATIQFKRGAASGIPTLAAGEPGWTTDTHELYIGTGAGNILIGPGVTVDLTTDTTGTLPVASGGTGVTSLASLDAADFGSGAATDGYVLTADGAGGAAWEAAPSGSLSDGDKGDITVSGSGATWTIDAGAVTLAKMASITGATLIGRRDGVSGTPEEITPTNSLLVDSATSTMALVGDSGAPGNNKLYGTNGSGTRGWYDQPAGSLSDGDKGDITVSSSGTVWTIDAGAVSYSKMQDVSAASRLLGRGSASGSGDVEEISVGTGLSMSGTTLSCTVTAHDAVTLAGTLDYLTLSGQQITRNAIDLATDVTGTLPAANGGTGVTALSSLNVNTLGSGAATDGYVATADGAGGVAWEAIPAAGLTHPDVMRRITLWR